MRMFHIGVLCSALACTTLPCMGQSLTMQQQQQLDDACGPLSGTGEKDLCEKIGRFSPDWIGTAHDYAHVMQQQHELEEEDTIHAQTAAAREVLNSILAEIQRCHSNPKACK